MRFMQGLGLSLIGVLVLSCGCGQGTKAPSALSYSTATAVYTKGVQIAPNSPTSAGGAVTSYSVSPALPAGLTLSTSTGVISGTPTVVIGSASYTVIAASLSGNSTASLSITVNDVAPASLSYASNAPTYFVNTTITNDFPSNTGGAVVTYSVLPALPAGLNLNTATGIISGTPAAVSPTAQPTR